MRTPSKRHDEGLYVCRRLRRRRRHLVSGKNSHFEGISNGQFGESGEFRRSMGSSSLSSSNVVGIKMARRSRHLEQEEIVNRDRLEGDKKKSKKEKENIGLYPISASFLPQGSNMRLKPRSSFSGNKVKQEIPLAEESFFGAKFRKLPELVSRIGSRTKRDTELIGMHTIDGIAGDSARLVHQSSSALTDSSAPLVPSCSSLLASALFRDQKVTETNLGISTSSKNLAQEQEESFAISSISIKIIGK